MKNELLTKGIILPSGEIGKNKINLVAGAITQPFAEMVWVTTGGDMETINRLTNVLVTMNNPTDRGKLFKIIKLLYGLMGLPFSEEAEPMDADPDVLEYFIFSFMADFGEVMQELIAEEMKQLHFACLCVDLDKDALAVRIWCAVRLSLTIEEGIVEHSLQGRFHNILIKLITQNTIHQGQCVAHCRIASAHIEPITVGNCRPAVTLATVTRIIVGVIGVGDDFHLAITDVVHNAVCRHRALGGVRDFLKGIAFTGVIGNFTIFRLSSQCCHGGQRGHRKHNACQ